MSSCNALQHTATHAAHVCWYLHVFMYWYILSLHWYILSLYRNIYMHIYMSIHICRYTSHSVCTSLLISKCHTATRCNTLQHTATRCNTLRHTLHKCVDIYMYAYIDMSWLDIHTYNLCGHTHTYNYSWHTHVRGANDLFSFDLNRKYIHTHTCVDIDLNYSWHPTPTRGAWPPVIRCELFIYMYHICTHIYLCIHIHLFRFELQWHPARTRGPWSHAIRLES